MTENWNDEIKTKIITDLPIENLSVLNGISGPADVALAPGGLPPVSKALRTAQGQSDGWVAGKGSRRWACLYKKCLRSVMTGRIYIGGAGWPNGFFPEGRVAQVSFRPSVGLSRSGTEKVGMRRGGPKNPILSSCGGSENILSLQIYSR